jgi:hypothetical protein
MPSLSLVEAAKIEQNPLIAGVIESIVTVNQMYRVLPFDQIVGNAISYTRENALGGVAPVGIGGGGSPLTNLIPSAAKTAATFTPITTSLKAIIGDAMVDHFVETTMSVQNSQRGVQIASKAKAIGREFQRQLIEGDEDGDPLEFDGLEQLVPGGQTIDADGAAYSFEYLDELISLIKAKDGAVDFIMMPDRALRKHLSLLRDLGGASISEVQTLPDGTMVVRYRGIPLYRNDYITVTSAGSPLVVTTDIYAGTFDDGSRKVGIAGLTSNVQSGIFVSNVGEAEDTNELITRLRFYCGLAVYSELGVGKLESVKLN